MDAHITDIYNHLVGFISISVKGDISISLVLSRVIRVIVITNLPLHITRYFTKIVLNYNPINNKIHLRTDSADEDIANTFGIIGNDKHFSNTHDVIVFLNSIMQQKQKQYNINYRRKYYKYKQKYLQLLEQK